MSENEGRNPSANPIIGDIIAERFSRRDMLKGALGVAAINTTLGILALSASPRAMAATSSFGFAEVETGVDEMHHVAF